LALIAGRHEDAIRLVEGAFAQSPPLAAVFAGKYRYFLGCSKQLAEGPAVARPIFEAARAELEKFLQEQPDSPDVQMYLGFTLMALGDKEGAMLAAQKAIALRPASTDAISGVAFEEALTRIRAHFGESDAAVSDLRRLLKTNYVGPEQIALTPALLRLDPVWNPLRSDRRFQELASEKQP
jgi:serine/threonine-protein kinase